MSLSTKWDLMRRRTPKNRKHVYLQFSPQGRPGLTLDWPLLEGMTSKDILHRHGAHIHILGRLLYARNRADPVLVALLVSCWPHIHCSLQGKLTLAEFAITDTVHEM